MAEFLFEIGLEEVPSHMFNLLDARGAISVTERVSVMARIRTLVIGVAETYVAQGEAVKGREQGSREQGSGEQGSGEQAG